MLLLACSSGDVDICALLLEHGADAEIADKVRNARRLPALPALSPPLLSPPHPRPCGVTPHPWTVPCACLRGP